MTLFVALLRGVNVGGRGKLAMAELRRITEACGYEDVATYVQSGNVVLRGTGSGSKVAATLRAAIAAGTSLDPAIAVRTAAQLAKIVDACPYDDTTNVHVTFRVEGGTALRADVQEAGFQPERYSVCGDEAYLYLPNGMGRSKLAGALSKGTTAQDGTTRNWRTVTKLLEMAGAT
ncbi:MAG: DUF1697 domain-containing protein [Ilumatobacteraceae bacterium]